MDTQSGSSRRGGLYEKLPTPTSIRVLQVESTATESNTLLSCTLHVVDLEDPTLNFNALSYTWGHPIFRPWYDNVPEILERQATISCNGVQVEITENLHAALQIIAQRAGSNAASSDGHGYLWVDSLCINQSDIEERNSQVGMMAQLYSKASLVISWLGPADDDSGVAIPFMQQLFPSKGLPLTEDFTFADGVLSFRERHSSKELSISVEHLESLGRFLGRRYFFRCWIIQEVLMARKLCILCGHTEIPFEHLWGTSRLVMTLRKQFNLAQPVANALALTAKCLRGNAHEETIYSICSYRSRRLSGAKQLDFQGLLSLTRSTHCFDPRDKIYGMLGMIAHQAFGILPDYNKCVEEVYSEAVRLWIKTSRNIDILSWVTNRPVRRFPSLPTWIGEFEASINQQELAFTNSAFKATGNSRAPLVELSSGMNTRMLTLRGALVDRILELAEPWAWHGLAVGYDPIWASMTLQLGATYPTGQTRGEALIHTFVANEVGGVSLSYTGVRPVVSSIMGLEDFKKRVRTDTCFALIRQLHRLSFYGQSHITLEAYTAAAQPILSDIDSLAQADNSDYIPRLSEIQVLELHTCDCAFTFSNPTSNSDAPSPNPTCLYITELSRNDAYTRSTLSDLPHAPSVPDAKAWDSLFSDAMNQKMHMRRVARTKKGYLSLAPDSAEVGDAIWLLQGGSVPYVLRTTSTKNERAAWEVVGEAYVHGVMNGEVWREVDDDDIVDVRLV